VSNDAAVAGREIMRMQTTLCSFFRMTSTVLVVLAAILALAAATPLPGAIMLDSLTFNKTASAFMNTVIKFDKAYPAGDAHVKQWAGVAKDLRDVPEVLVAEVRIREHGKEEGSNRDLAKRFGLEDKEVLPEVILLKRKGKNKFEEHRFGAELTKDNVIAFLKQKTGVYLNLPGCNRRFDSMARWFLRAEDGEKRKEVLDKTEKDHAGVKDEVTKAVAAKYVRVMKQILENGDEWVLREEDRINRVLRDKVSDEKRADLEVRIEQL